MKCCVYGCKEKATHHIIVGNNTKDYCLKHLIMYEEGNL